MKKFVKFFCILLTMELVTACASRNGVDVSTTSVQRSAEVVETPAPTETVADVADTEDEVEEELDNDANTAETDFVSLKISSKSKKEEQTAKRKSQKKSQKEYEYYRKMKNIYLYSKWDGKSPKKIGKHTFSVSEGTGYLLMDGYNMDYEECLDLAKTSLGRYNHITIPGKGTYLIKKGNILSYFKGKKIFERKLECLREDETKFSLYYDSKDDKMFLMTAVQGPISDFLYVFSDYDTSSEVEYLGEFGCVTTDLIEYLDGEGKYKTIIFGKYK